MATATIYTGAFAAPKAYTVRYAARKGSYRGRYEIYVDVPRFDPEHVGWVIKRQRYEDSPGLWDAYAVEIDWRDGQPTGRGGHVLRSKRREDGIDAILWQAIRNRLIHPADLEEATL